MKLFHTGDWHIGKLINNRYMTEDQAHVLDQMFGLIEREKPDAVIIAGDIYDRAVPPLEAIELLDRSLRTIVRDLKTPVIALAGNHDSNERIGFGSELLSGSGLHLSGIMTKEIPPIILNDENGPVHFYSIPYADAAVVRAVYDDPEIRTQDDAMRRIIESIHERRDSSARTVVVAHGYVVKNGENPETSESERPLGIGGTEAVDASIFAPFTYAALGHLHSPQKAGYDHVRYSGSLLKYSFSEFRQKKGVTIVDIDSEGKASTSFLEFTPLRDMRVIKGELKDLVSREAVKSADADDYIKAILTDKGELIDAMSTLRSVYPNVLEMTKEENDGGSGSASIEMLHGRTTMELFSDFYNSMIGEKCPDEFIPVMKDIIDDAEKGADA